MYWPDCWLKFFWEFRTVYIRELRELDKFEGAWWKPPVGFMRYADVPNIYHSLQTSRRLTIPYDFAWDMYWEYSQRVNWPSSAPGSEEMTILYRMVLCVQNINPAQNCPDPCNEPDVCAKVEHSTGVCIKISDDTVDTPALGEISDVLRPIYHVSAKCPCQFGYKFIPENRSCVYGLDGCKLVQCKFPHSCEQKKGVPGDITCICQPGYIGDDCGTTIDICNDPEHNASKLCDRATCSNDISMLSYGFKCNCLEVPGLEYLDQGKSPFCVDMDECRLTQGICQNGGTCVNTYGSYVCFCTTGFAGKLCNRQLANTIFWLSWGPYSTCTQTCGHGYHISRRRCSVEGRCKGTATQFLQCTAIPYRCPESEFDDGFLYDSWDYYNHRQRERLPLTTA